MSENAGGVVNRVDFDFRLQCGSNSCPFLSKLGSFDSSDAQKLLNKEIKTICRHGNYHI